MKKRVLSFWLVILVLFSALTIKYFLPVDNHFQNDSEALVVGAVIHQRQGLSNLKYGLSWALHSDGYWISTFRCDPSVAAGELEFPGYASQIGLQGYVFAFLSHLLGFLPVRRTLFLFRLLCSAAMAIVVMLISWLVGKKYNRNLSIAFFITFFCSPWIDGFAPNLYWVSFTWFLPMLIGLIVSLDYNRYDKWWIYLLTFLAVCLKSACGYEYLSTVLMAMIAFPICDFLLTIRKDPQKGLHILWVIIKLGVTAVLGFLCVLLIHAYMRGEGNLFKGIESIWKIDVLRRTLGGNPDDFDPILVTSIEASVWDVIYKYLCFNPNVVGADIIDGIRAVCFIPMLVYASMSFVFHAVKKENAWEMILFVLLILTTLSWFILGKSHSFVHTHMNYVLWYFGCVQMCIYALVTLAEKTLHILFCEENL